MTNDTEKHLPLDKKDQKTGWIPDKSKSITKNTSS